MLNSPSAATPEGAKAEQLFNARPIGSALFQSVIGLVVTTSRNFSRVVARAGLIEAVGRFRDATR